MTEKTTLFLELSEEADGRGPVISCFFPLLLVGEEKRCGAVWRGMSHRLPATLRWWLLISLRCKQHTGLSPVPVCVCSVHNRPASQQAGSVKRKVGRPSRENEQVASKVNYFSFMLHCRHICLLFRFPLQLCVGFFSLLLKIHYPWSLLWGCARLHRTPTSKGRPCAYLATKKVVQLEKLNVVVMLCWSELSDYTLYLGHICQHGLKTASSRNTWARTQTICHFRNSVFCKPYYIRSVSEPFQGRLITYRRFRGVCSLAGKGSLEELNGVAFQYPDTVALYLSG